MYSVFPINPIMSEKNLGSLKKKEKIILKFGVRNLVSVLSNLLQKFGVSSQ